MVWLPQESFNLGELSPSILGMGSSDNIKKGCKVLENAFLTTTGGAKRRPGTKLVTTLPDSDGAYLVPYHASDNSYMLVFSYSETVKKLYVYDSENSLVAWNDGFNHGPYPSDPISTQGNHPLGEDSGPIHHFQHENRVYILSNNNPPLSFEKVYKEISTYLFGNALVNNGSPQLISYLPDIAITVEDIPGEHGNIYGLRQLVSDSPFFVPSDGNAEDNIWWNGITDYIDNSIWRVRGEGEGEWPQGPNVSSPTTYEEDSSWFEGMKYINSRTLQGKFMSSMPGEDAYDWTGPYIHDELWTSVTMTSVYKYNFFYLSNLPTHVQNNIAANRDVYSGRILTNRITPNVGTANDWIPEAYMTGLDIIDGMGIATGTDSSGLSAGTKYLRIFQNGFCTTYGEYQSAGGGKSFSLKKLPADRPGVPKIATFATGSFHLGSGGASTTVFGNFDSFGSEENFLPWKHTIPFDGTDGTATLGGAVYIAHGAGRATSIAAQADSIVYGYHCTGTQSRLYYGPTFNWGYGWSFGTKFPTAGASHQARVFFSGMEEKLQNVVVGSHTGRPDDFIVGPNDADSLRFVLSNLVGNGIRWLISQQDLLIGSELAEFKMSGLPLTPTNVGVELQSTYGSRNGMAAQIGTTTMFVTRDGKSIREMGFSDRSNRFESTSLTSLAEHLWLGYTRGETTYPAQEVTKIIVLIAPDICVMALGSEGSLNILSYQRDNGVLGWSPTAPSNSTDSIEEIAMLTGYPSGNPDRAYMIVDRGETICLEYMANGNILDSQDNYTAADGVIDGLDHLIGREVQVTSGSSPISLYVGSFTVDSEGEIDLGVGGSSTYVVGLPFTFKLTPTVQEIQRRDGFTHGHKRNYDRTLLYFSNTRGVVVAGYELQILPLANFEVPDAIEGWTSIPVLGLYGQNPDLEITHNNPFSVEIQSISTEVSYSD